ncbi:MAG TPA: AarF/UbiB family protein [Rudaea sp.]|jgi:predicted unusual protein kinase regulating ubiquinone biosynthesis (AarF/ABC1/UbiB family)|nr:AarF/UbiB family protein [Rudaea sp.]
MKSSHTTAALGRSPALLRFALKYRHLWTDPEGVRATREDAQAFASDIQSLGPAFVKIGQALSIRPDLLPRVYLESLEQLQDDLPAVPFEEIREVIERELSIRVSHAFASLDETPLAAASLAQVHAATLRDGREVVIKVQRPRIAEEIRTDLAVLTHLARTADAFTEQGYRVQFVRWIEEMSETLAEELDYCLEADNLRLFRTQLADYPTLFVPAPLADFSTKHVLTMERVTATKINAAVGLRRLDEPLDDYAGDLMRAYLDQIFVNGLVHADPHPGNVLLMHRGLALIDLGMVARLSPHTRDTLLALFAGAINGDGDEVARQTVMLGEKLESYDERAWCRRCGRLISRFATQSDAMNFRAGTLMIELTRQSVESGLRPPPEIALLGRTLLALEGVTEMLSPKLSARDVVREHMNSIVAKRIKQEVSWYAVNSQLADIAALGREFPRQARAFLETLGNNCLQIRLGGLEESRLLENLRKIANRISISLVAAALVIGAALALRIDAGPKLLGYPGIALVMFVLAFALAIGLVISALVSDRRGSRRR